jgi:adenosylcobyric acid synthase
VITVRIVWLPNSAIPEEFDALAAEPGVDLAFVESPSDLGVPDMVVLPGSEATIPDVTRMREIGMDSAICRAAEGGALLFGICGGFQMMGREILDPEGLEGGAPRATGLGVFDLSTLFTRDDIDEPVRATGAAGGFLTDGGEVSGFERHGGRSTLQGDDAVHLFNETARGGDASCPLGITTRDYSAMGTYLHGVLADPVFRRRILEHLRSRKADTAG